MVDFPRCEGRGGGRLFRLVVVVADALFSLEGQHLGAEFLVTWMLLVLCSYSWPRYYQRRTPS